MRKLLFTFACLCVLASLARAQDPTYPTTYSRGGNLTTSSANCDPTACLGIGLPTPSAAVITVGLIGTWSGTLAVEESQDGGRTFTSAGASLTSTGTSSYVIAGFTSFRVRAGTLSSGNVGVNFTVSNAPSGGVTSGTGAPSGSCTANQIYVNQSNGNLYTCSAGSWVLSGGGGSGTVTNIATTGPITGGPITTTGTIACPTCVTSAASLGSGNVVSGAGGQAVQDSTIPTSTLVTSAAALTSNAVVLGAGSQGTKVVAGITTDGISVLNLGGIGVGNGRVNFNGNTSGQSSAIVNSTGTAVTFSGNVLAAILSGNTLASTVATGTAPITVASTTNVANLNASSLGGATFASPGSIGGTTPGAAKFTTITETALLISNAAPTIAAGGCGGSAASISAVNGTASFNINVGTGPTSAGCTVTLPTATTGWNCFVNDFTTISTAVSMQKQTASGTASATFQNYSDLTVATAPTANDIYHVSCFAN